MAKSKLQLPKFELYKDGDFKRELEVLWDYYEKNEKNVRTDFWRDYARLIHSPSFRKLKGKTQLFPGMESDFFRWSLTHLLEVAEIGKSIANHINYKLKTFFDTKKIYYDQNSFINTDLVSLACIAHDIGHPPFGHQGEYALDECMKEYGGFEGNAQTLRIISKLEKKDYAESDDNDFTGFSGTKDLRKGLNLCYRSIASILKYDNCIPETRGKQGKLFKGYYKEEETLVETVKQNILNISSSFPFKTIECQIMDIADDIAYSVYDLEDSLKGGFIEPIDLFTNKDIQNFRATLAGLIRDKGNRESIKNFRECDERKVNDVLFDIFFPDRFGIDVNDKDVSFSSIAIKESKMLSSNGYLRSKFCSNLVTQFIYAVDLEFVDLENPCLTKVKLNEDIMLKIEVLKRLTYEYQIQSAKLKIVEFNGKNIVKRLFEVFTTNTDEIKGFEFLPEDVLTIYNKIKEEKNDIKREQRIKRTICDFIAGMTNSYAIEYYNRLFSTSGISIHKPIN